MHYEKKKKKPRAKAYGGGKRTMYKDGEMKWRQTGEQDANTLIGLVQQYF